MKIKKYNRFISIKESIDTYIDGYTQELKDLGFNIKILKANNYVKIYGDLYGKEIEVAELIKDIDRLNDRMVDDGYELINKSSKLKIEWNYIEFSFNYKSNIDIKDYTINNLDQFIEYYEATTGNTMDTDWDNAADDKIFFRIDGTPYFFYIMADNDGFIIKLYNDKFDPELLNNIDKLDDRLKDILVKSYDKHVVLKFKDAVSTIDKIVKLRDGK